MSIDAAMRSVLALVVAVSATVFAPAFAPSAGAATVEVEVGNFFFDDDDLTIPPGTTVSWAWSAGSHTVTSDDATGTLDSGTRSTGDTYEVTFDDAGTFTYFCEIHPGMTGSVTVAEGAPLPTPQPDPVDDVADTVATALAWSGLVPDGGATTAFVGRSDGFADSLASGAGQGILDGVLLLTPTDELDDRVGAELTRLGVNRVIVLGGTAAISDATLAEIRALVPDTERVAGLDRLETSRAVADLVAPDATTIILARAFGDGSAAFADSLSAGAVGGANGWPVVLVGQTLDQATRDFLVARDPSAVVIAGGTAAVPEAVAQAVADAGLAVSRAAGVDRISTAVALGQLIETPSPARALVEGYGANAWASGFAAAFHASGGIHLAIGGVDGLPSATGAALFGSGATVRCGPTLAAETCRQAQLMTTVGEAMFTVTLDGDGEVPPNDGTGAATASLHPSDDQLCARVEITAALTGPVTAAHVHDGDAGDSGPAVGPIPLVSDGRPGLAFGCFADGSSVTIADLEADPAGHYLNLHTEAFPGGELRGQLERVPPFS